MEFLKFFGVVLLFAGGSCGAMGLLPYPITVVAALIIVGVVIHHHRNRSLV